MKKARKALYYSLAPLLTGLLLMVVFWKYDLYPFGKNTLAWCDMRQQVVPLWMQLKDVLAGNTSPFYSFGAAGGMNFWGVLFFFVASPLSLLVAFWDKGDLLFYANVITVVKLMLCSLSAVWYFNRRHRNLAPGLAVLLSVCYAFSGYAMLFYQNSVWLDIMALFPLLYLALDRMAEGRGSAAYCVVLTFSIVVNYYLSYALLLFLVLSAGVIGWVRLDAAARRRFALQLGGATAIALALSAPVWLPSLIEVMVSARTVGLVESLSQGSFWTHLYTTLPFLYCSVVPIAVALFAFSGHTLGNRRARADAILFALMLVPIVIDPINKVWHTGSYQAFPVRYGFILVLLALSLAAAALERDPAEEEPTRSRRWAVAGSCGALAVAGAVSEWLYRTRFKELSAYTRKLWGDKDSFLLLSIWAAAFLVAMGILMLYRRHKMLSSRVFCAMTAVLIAGQSLFSGAIYIGSAANSSGYLPWITAMEGKIQETDFYRVKAQRKLFDVNLIGGLGYNTLAHYTSLTREDFLFTTKRLGYSAYWMEAGSHGGTVITDALLSNRYTIKNDGARKRSDQLVYSNLGYWIFENPYQLPLGLVSGRTPQEIEHLPDLERANTGEWMLNQLVGTKTNLVTSYDPSILEFVDTSLDERGRYHVSPEWGTEAVMRYYVTVEKPTFLYIDCYDAASTRLSEPINGSLAVRVNDVERTSFYPSQRENGLLELGLFQPGDEVSVDVTVLKAFTARSFGLVGVDANALSDTLAVARTADLHTAGRTITGTADAWVDETLFLSIPYAEGWSATVNGQPTPVHKVMDTFMGLELQQGHNTISMTFTPEGLKAGLLAMAAGLLAVAVLLLLHRKKVAAPAALERVADVLMLGCFAALLGLVYLLPIFLNLMA